MTPTPEEVAALVKLLHKSLLFSYLAGGEGLSILGVAPEDFLMDYSLATGDEDWETLACRVAAALTALQARAEAAEARVREVEAVLRDLTDALVLADDDFQAYTIALDSSYANARAALTPASDTPAR